MAWVSRGFWANFVVVDIANTASNFRVQMQGSNYTDAAADMAAFRTLLEAMTGGTVKRSDLTEVVDNDAWVISTEDVLCNDKALLTIALASAPDKKAAVAVPAPTISIMVDASGPGYNVVDSSDAAVIAFVDAFVATTGYAKISDGEYGIAAASGGLVAGRRVSRKISKS